MKGYNFFPATQAALIYVMIDGRIILIQKSLRDLPQIGENHEISQSLIIYDHTDGSHACWR